jgi:DNA-directed RNA polymerase II subunit RPB2
MSNVRGDVGTQLAEKLLRTYFRTQDYPFTRHHIESYDQFLSQDLPAIIKAENPLTILEDPIGSTGFYALQAEIFIGGLEGNRIYIGTPTINLRDAEEIRVMYPNEARLRNLNYVSQIEADIVIRLKISRPNPSGGAPMSETILMDPEKDAAYSYLAKFPLLKMPIMLHSRYCLLYGKPQSFLKEVGECIYDSGGYFIVDGAEKVLITRQEAAFNTLYITQQKSDPDVSIYSSISCLNPETRQVKRVSFTWQRLASTLHVNIPFVRDAIPIFVLFRAMGLQADEDIVRAILPDPESAESKILEPLLHESILEAFPLLDTYSAIQYIKVLTKGFSEAHVLNVLQKQTFIHVENRPGARLAFLSECVRRILRVQAGIDAETDRDDIRNQRCLTSGILTRMLFQDVYKVWKKGAILKIDEQYNYNSSLYSDMNFQNLFQQGILNEIFKTASLTDGIFRGFKGKWGAGLGEEKTGAIQPLSRLSYMDFMSHCRRVVLDFDTGLAIPGPRRLHPSQFGYFCTSETPGGGSIGITKNLSILTMISTGTEPASFIKWLIERGGVMGCDEMTADTVGISVPVFVNSGIIGYTQSPALLRDVLKVMKWTGCLPVSASISFSIRDRRVNVYMDEGRPIRPLVHLEKTTNLESLGNSSWRDLIMGSLPLTKERGLFQTGFIDPLSNTAAPRLEDYIKALTPYIGSIEYVDPYEANEAYIAMFPDYIKDESSHLEIHPSTMMGLLTSVIPFANHNQSPRNQLSCSQSKQGLSVYATNYPNRFDNMVHVLSYGEAPIVRTLYYDYIADGQMPYGQNLMVAIGSFTGYNQDDGIIFNADSFQRGMFRNMTFKSYETFEEDDEQAKTRTRVGNPARIPGWTSLKPGLDYSKLDERGIIRVGEYADESTVLVGMYLQTQGGEMRDASLTAQVWTRGRVEKVAVMTNNLGRALIKIRVIQDRIPELGDKFSTRHGQKGTIGMLIRAHDMPRTADGMVPDMIVNPHCMPSRMTMAQLLESLLGKAAPGLGVIGNATAFMNDGNPSEQIGKVLTEQLGMDALGDDLLYDGMSGSMIPSTIFMGNIYIMRLKHMPEDKWNARAEGRKEQRTHQPTGGRGNQGGLRIGEMERDAIVGHGIMDFVRESYMKRADAYTTYVCNSCGTIPIYNESKKLYVCSMCDGPVNYIGDSATTLELLPPSKRSAATFSKVEIPYATKLLDQELAFFLNMSMRMLTERDVTHLRGAPLVELTADQQTAALAAKLPERTLLDTVVPERIEKKDSDFTIRPEDLSALGLEEMETEEAARGFDLKPKVNSRVLNAAVEAAVNAALTTSTVPGKVNSAVVNAAVNAAIAASNAMPEEKAAPAPGPSQITGMGGLQFTSAQPQPQTEEEGLGADDYETFPEDSEVAPGLDMPRRSQPQSQVNVQTSTQPVLVVPLNMAQQAPPAEYIGTAAPGAPPTFAVDTSQKAMGAAGFDSVPRSRPASRSPSRSPSRSGSAQSSGPQISSSTAPATRVNVIKEG